MLTTVPFYIFGCVVTCGHNWSSSPAFVSRSAAKYFSGANSISDSRTAGGTGACTLIARSSTHGFCCPCKKIIQLNMVLPGRLGKREFHLKFV